MIDEHLRTNLTFATPDLVYGGIQHAVHIVSPHLVVELLLELWVKRLLEVCLHSPLLDATTWPLLSS